MLEKKKRYLQIAFNDSSFSMSSILSSIPYNERIIIEAGTPLIKKEGIGIVRKMRLYWKGKIVADLKTADGALGEVDMAYGAGADGATVLGSAPRETINIFIKRCRELGMFSMIDMLGVDDPLKVLRELDERPDVVILHRGRDEENTRGKVIGYRHVNRIKGKYDILISAAGGVDLKEARSAIFNGASIVVVNVVGEEDPWTGIGEDEDIVEITNQFLKTIE